jgi:hypothetical protein
MAIIRLPERVGSSRRKAASGFNFFGEASPGAELRVIAALCPEETFDIVMGLILDRAKSDCCSVLKTRLHTA